MAYRAGAGLRVVAGDGSEDRALDESVAPLPPSWSPLGRPELAYVDARGALRLLDAAGGRPLARATALPGIGWLEWGGRGDVLLEASRRQIQVRAVAAAADGAPRLGRPRPFHLPAGETVGDVALSPDGTKVAALLAAGAGGIRRTDLVLFDLGHRAPVRLLSVRGRLREVAWAPHGSRLLVGWPRFDEWLFLPTRPLRGRAVTGVSQAFATGSGAAAFPRVEGWCCRAVPGDDGG